MTSQKHIHIIGICGVATSAIAIAFKNKGWKVTGSDKGFFPPVSTELEKHGVDFYAGWHPEKIGRPDLVLAATASGTQNPETAYVKENSIPIKSDAEIRGEYFAKKNSIVCAGTWGKTSSTALLSHILLKNNFDPSFVIGGIPISTDPSRLGDSDWSVIEGDEYKSSPWDNRPKFAHLKTTHLLLSAISWDHADLYPTEESYFEVFRNLISKTKFIVANKDNAKVRELVSNAIWYGTKDADYTYREVSQSSNGLDFIINHNSVDYKIHSQLIGKFQAENITGCFAMASEIGIKPEVIIKAIADFKGMKRRLEKRFVGDITVFDDIAHSPEKASTILSNLKEIYSGKVIAIFEPNIGGRSRESIAKYDNAFRNADIVIIPRLTKLKIAENELEQPMEGDELASSISKTHDNVKYIDDDNALVDFIKDSAKKGDCVAFLGSHGFRGMIGETIKALTISPRQQSQ
jgi:UDP-N-acetylmuramate: L-alanyl-gamma-D-glutamyl-meso-diaminopimelate ligase